MNYRIEPAASIRRRCNCARRQVHFASGSDASPPSPKGNPQSAVFWRARTACATMSARAIKWVFASNIRQEDQTTVHVDGVGLHGLTAAEEIIDLGNSGTAMRLLAGLLSGQAFDDLVDRRCITVLGRPMGRIIGPLTANGRTYRGQRGQATAENCWWQRTQWQSTTCSMPVASAQVKSAVLLAGLYARGRDHGSRAGDNAESYRAHAGIDGRQPGHGQAEHRVTMEGGQRNRKAESLTGACGPVLGRICHGWLHCLAELWRGNYQECRRESDAHRRDFHSP